MKRSEFIKKVLESGENTVFVNEEQVENALSVFESFEMLPPTRIIEECNRDEYPDLTDYSFYEFCWREEVNTWESEDEN